MNEFYALKMENPTKVDLYTDITISTTDLDTGETAYTKTLIQIKRAVVSSFTTKYKFFHPTDGTYERSDTIVLIDHRDLRTYVFGKEDYFVIRGKKYNIVTHDFVYGEGHIFIIRGVQNEAPKQELTFNIFHTVQLGSSYDQS